MEQKLVDGSFRLMYKIEVLPGKTIKRPVSGDLPALDLRGWFSRR